MLPRLEILTKGKDLWNLWSPTPIPHIYSTTHKSLVGLTKRLKVLKISSPHPTTTPSKGAYCTHTVVERCQLAYPTLGTALLDGEKPPAGGKLAADANTAADHPSMSRPQPHPRLATQLNCFAQGACTEGAALGPMVRPAHSWTGSGTRPCNRPRSQSRA